MIRLNGIVLTFLAALCFHGFIDGAARAQTFNEVKFNPDAGSRWQIVSVSDSEETKPGSPTVIQKITATSEVTIDEKLPNGFRVSYVMKDLRIEGNAPARELVETAFSGMTGVVRRGRIDASGKPVAIDNLPEVKASVNTMIEKMAKAFETKPAVADFLRQMLGGFLNADIAQAPELYMEDLTPLAAGQTTGLVPGNVKRQDTSVATPFGGSIKSLLETRIESFDATTGKVRYIRKQVFDREALMAVTLAMTQKLVSAADTKNMTPEVMKMMKDIKFDIESEMVITVEGGMTRKIDDRTVTTAQLMGHIMRKTEKKIMTVTRVN